MSAGTALARHGYQVLQNAARHHRMSASAKLALSQASNCHVWLICRSKYKEPYNLITMVTRRIAGLRSALRAVISGAIT